MQSDLFSYRREVMNSQCAWLWPLWPHSFGLSYFHHSYIPSLGVLRAHQHINSPEKPHNEKPLFDAWIMLPKHRSPFPCSTPINITSQCLEGNQFEKHKKYVLVSTQLRSCTV